MALIAPAWVDPPTTSLKRLSSAGSKSRARARKLAIWAGVTTASGQNESASHPAVIPASWMARIASAGIAGRDVVEWQSRGLGHPPNGGDLVPNV